MKTGIDIIITSYNGKHLLQKQLPVVIENSPEADKIIVIDDGSVDCTVEFLEKEFPRVTPIFNHHNLGFSKSTNRAVSTSRADFIVLLNNDVFPQKDYLFHALKAFKDPKIFAVTFNETNSSWPQVNWSDGKFQYLRGKDKTKQHFSAWASGGSAMFRRSVWNKLGGFNPIYSPGYWEDIDIGWRAWQNNYQIVWEPMAKVVHRHESTFSKLNPKFVNLVKQRNELLFIWQNFTEPPFVISHLAFLVKYTFTHLGYLKVIFSALVKYIVEGKKHSILQSNQSIIDFLNKQYES